MFQCGGSYHVLVARALFLSDQTPASLVALRTTWRGIPRRHHMVEEQW